MPEGLNSTPALPTAFTAAGNWQVRIKGTAGLIAAAETTLAVRESAFINP
jgi:hypothetical protein